VGGGGRNVSEVTWEKRAVGRDSTRKFVDEIRVATDFQLAI